MIEVLDNIPTVQCDCDPHLIMNNKPLGHIQDGVLHTQSPPPKRKKNVKRKEAFKKKKVQKELDTIKFKEIPPVVDEQGEHSEVQVFEEFNPDEILASLYNTPPPPPHCPRCVVPMCDFPGAKPRVA